MRIRYFMDDNGGDDDEIGGALVVRDYASLAAFLADSSYDMDVPTDLAEILAVLESGEYLLASVVVDPQADSGDTTSDFVSGQYLPTVEILNINDGGNDAALFVDGDYVTQVVVQNGNDAGNDNAEFVSGIMTQQVFPAPSQVEAGSVDANFLSGAYT